MSRKMIKDEMPTQKHVVVATLSDTLFWYYGDIVVLGVAKALEDVFDGFSPSNILVCRNDKTKNMVIQLELCIYPEQEATLREVVKLCFGKGILDKNFVANKFDYNAAKKFNGPIEVDTSTRMVSAFRKFKYGNKVVDDDIDNAIVDVAYQRMCDSKGNPSTTTVCHLTLDTGYTVRGESSCVSAENYDAGLGKKYAYEDARRKVWSILGAELIVMKRAQEYAMRRIEELKNGATFATEGEAKYSIKELVRAFEL